MHYLHKQAIYIYNYYPKIYVHMKGRPMDFLTWVVSYNFWNTCSYLWEKLWVVNTMTGTQAESSVPYHSLSLIFISFNQNFTSSVKKQSHECNPVTRCIDFKILHDIELHTLGVTSSGDLAFHLHRFFPLWRWETSAVWTGAAFQVFRGNRHLVTPEAQFHRDLSHWENESRDWMNFNKQVHWEARDRGVSKGRGWAGQTCLLFFLWDFLHRQLCRLQQRQFSSFPIIFLQFPFLGVLHP